MQEQTQTGKKKGGKTFVTYDAGTQMQRRTRNKVRLGRYTPLTILTMRTRHGGQKTPNYLPIPFEGASEAFVCARRSVDHLLRSRVSINLDITLDIGTDDMGNVQGGKLTF
jgi:hypothetical protein